MSDLLLEDNLTTADIARPPTLQQEPAATMGHDPEQADQVDAQPTQSATTTSITDAGPLFPDDELNNFRTRWKEVQTSFVDEPRQAVEQADSLVANVVKRVAEQFAAERATLEDQWSNGDNVSTEDLRQSLKRYRSFFDRLLSF